MSNIYDVIVIGGGQAGLAAGYHLQRAGLNFIILEANAQPGGSWPAYYDSLKLFSPARYSSLPGLPFPGDPNRYPLRDEVVDYLRAYAEHFHLPIMTNALVENVARTNSVFEVRSATDILSSHAIVAATGAFSKPFIPQLPGQRQFKGQILHSAAYRRSDTFTDRRVIVVGAGNSAVQIAFELARNAHVTLASREPVVFRRQVIHGQDIHFWLRLTGLDTLPVKYFNINRHGNGVLDTGIDEAAIRAGRPDSRAMFTQFTEDGIVWPDGKVEPIDAVVFATGYQPNLDYLRNLGELDAAGMPYQREGISTKTPGLYYVGLSMQRSFASATLRGVGSDAAYITRHLRSYLRAAGRPEIPAVERTCRFCGQFNDATS